MIIFLYFCRKIKDLSMKRNIKTFYTLIIYSRIHLFLADASTGIRQHQTGRETTLG